MSLVCPDCNAMIEFCVEENILHKRILDPKTGKLKKRVRVESQGNDANHALFKCTQCCWSCTDGSNEYGKLINACNADDLNQLLSHVQEKQLGNP